MTSHGALLLSDRMHRLIQQFSLSLVRICLMSSSLLLFVMFLIVVGAFRLIVFNFIVNALIIKSVYLYLSVKRLESPDIVEAKLRHLRGCLLNLLDAR